MSRGTALVVAALAASILASVSTSGVNATHPDDRAGLRGPGDAVVTGAPDVIDRYLAAHVQSPEASGASTARPDDRAGALGAASAEATASSSDGGGFDWRDAGLGAAVAAGTLLVGGWLAQRVRIHRGGRGGLLTH